LVDPHIGLITTKIVISIEKYQDEIDGEMKTIHHFLR